MRRHSKRINVTLPEPHREWLRREARARGMRPMTFLRSLIARALETTLLPPPPPQARCSLDLAPELHQALQARARALGYPSTAAFVRAIVREHADPLGRVASRLGFHHIEELLNSIACGATALLPLPEEHFRYITWLEEQAAQSFDPLLREFLMSVARSMKEALQRREEEEYTKEALPDEASLRERIQLLSALLASKELLTEEVARDLRRLLAQARRALEEAYEEN